MFRYDTHIHTAPVSKCAKASVRETLEFYKRQSFDGVFITNHFLDGNINGDRSLPYAEQLEYYLSDYYDAVGIGKELGIKVFFGVEMTEKGSDFLIYGLDPDWYRAHPEIMGLKKSKLLPILKEAGALVVHAHPFRQADYIDHIRLYPPQTEGVEVINGCRTDLENMGAEWYANQYGFCKTAGSDNHIGPQVRKLAGIGTATPIGSVEDFIGRIRSGNVSLFYEDNPERIG